MENAMSHSLHNFIWKNLKRIKNSQTDQRITSFSTTIGAFKVITHNNYHEKLSIKK